MYFMFELPKRISYFLVIAQTYLQLNCIDYKTYTRTLSLPDTFVMEISDITEILFAMNVIMTILCLSKHLNND